MMILFTVYLEFAVRYYLNITRGIIRYCLNLARGIIRYCLNLTRGIIRYYLNLTRGIIRYCLNLTRFKQNQIIPLAKFKQNLTIPLVKFKQYLIIPLVKFKQNLIIPLIKFKQIELIFANTSIIKYYWFFSDVEHFFPGIAPLVSILLFPKNIDDRACAQGFSKKNGGCITSHNNLNTRGEQAFYTKYTGK
jgi:hypothetical protein